MWRYDTGNNGEVRAYESMDTPRRKIDQLVADARNELQRLGIETEGKRSDELFNMVREQRNKLRVTQLKLQ